VKHGVVVSLVNVYAETIGNPVPPSCIAGVRRTALGAVTTRKGLSPVGRAIFIIATLLLILAIVSVIFAPTIMRSFDKNRATSAAQPSATASPSLSDAIQNMVKQRITDELQKGFSRKSNAPRVAPTPRSQPTPPAAPVIRSVAFTQPTKPRAHLSDPQSSIRLVKRNHALNAPS
jgi:hypothetical protein